MNKLIKNTGIILILFMIYNNILNNTGIESVGIVLNVTWALLVSTCGYFLAELSLRCINYK